MIRYVKHKEINKKLWDQCITDADNRLVYVNSWYLDIICPEWNALISDDYKAVMPIPVRRKFGILYMYKPLFIQQMGMFGKDISEDLIDSFIHSIPAEIKLADIILNEQNHPDAGKYTLQKNNNYKLNIKNPYELIEKQYHRNCRRNINKAVAAGLRFSSSLTIQEFTDLLEEQIESQTDSFGSKEKNQFRYLLQETLNRGTGEIVGVYNEVGDLLASGFYLFSFNRLMFMVCGSAPEGKNHQAMYMLIDEQIKRYAGKYNWYDFQGSNMEGVAHFNSTFGAVPYNYFSLHINRLPRLVKLLAGKGE